MRFHYSHTITTNNLFRKIQDYWTKNAKCNKNVVLSVVHCGERNDDKTAKIESGLCCFLLRVRISSLPE